MNALKIIQVNLNKQTIASEQLRDICLTDKVDIILAQDPFIAQGQVSGFEGCRQILTDDHPEAAIIIVNNRIKAIKLGQFTTRHVAVARIGIGHRKDDIVIASAYFRHNQPTTIFTEQLTNISLACKRLLIGADCNGHSLRWYNEDTNRRGKIVEEMIDDQELYILNVPQNLKTYKRHGMGEANIDITLASMSIHNMVKGWSVTDRIDSDHRLLEMTLSLKCQTIDKPDIKFNTKRADWDKFKLVLLGLKPQIHGDSIDELADRLTKVIIKAAKLSIPTRGKTKTGLITPPWWTDELVESKRLLQKARRENLHETNRQAYGHLRNQHLQKIRTAKMSSWREFSADMNTNHWGKTFRWAKSGSRKNHMPTTVKTREGTYTTDLKDTINAFLEVYLPKDQDQLIPMPYVNQIENAAVVDMNEVKEAIWKMRPDKAPGLDGITAKMLRVSWPIISENIVNLYEMCIRTAKFPTCWKTANLVIIPKAKGKDPLLTGSYRPISLLPTLGKALESLIASRLEKETGLNEIGQQHGYVPGRSTETAVKALYEWVDHCPNKTVIGVFLDITGAFDYVRWQPIFDQLKSLKIKEGTLALLESYLTNRWATLTIGNETGSRQMTRGCPQGSRLGPTLWKIAMSDVFKITGPQSHIITYADDIALAAGGARLETVKRRLVESLDHLKCWSKKFGLEFSATKSQVMTLKGGIKPTYTIPFGSDANAQIIKAARTTKYLGVVIDPRRSFWDHVLSVSDKSTDMFKRLCSMTSANWGIDQSTSMVIYKAVLLPRITYAASIWGEALKLKRTINNLGSIQRQALIA